MHGHEQEERGESGERVLFLDFDHTLFTSNSTELFIAACKPSIAAAIIEFVVRRCIPWRLTGVSKWYRLRDYACVLCLCLLLPWNILLWKRRAPSIFADHVSAEVADRIRDIPRHRIIILSFGFDFIIRALIARSEYCALRVVATPLFSGVERFQHAKTWLAVRAVGGAAAQEAMFITDSAEDLDLIQYCAQGIQIEQQGESFSARQELYIPFRYFAGGKYTARNALDRIVFVDMFIFVFAVAQDLQSLWVYLLICPLFALSMLCIYEIGYYENDFRAARREARPTLRPHHARFRNYPIQSAAWIWGGGFGALGLAATIFLLDLSREASAFIVVGWIAALIFVRVSFFIYNRLPAHLRIFMYPVLQVGKYGAIFLVLPASPFGVLLVLSQIATLWLNYIVYRLRGVPGTFPQEQFRAGFLLVSTAFLVLDDWAHAEPVPAALTEPGGLSCLLAIMLWAALRVVKAVIMKRLTTPHGKVPTEPAGFGGLTTSR